MVSMTPDTQPIQYHLLSHPCSLHNTNTHWVSLLVLITTLFTYYTSVPYKFNHPRLSCISQMFSVQQQSHMPIKSVFLGPDK